MTTDVFRPQPGHENSGTIGDSAPDTWANSYSLVYAAMAPQKNRAVHTLQERDLLLGVSDAT